MALSVVLAGTLGGVAAIIAVTVFLTLRWYFKRRRFPAGKLERTQKPKFKPQPSNPHRIPSPAVPKPKFDVKTATLTEVEGGHSRAVDYVVKSESRFQRLRGRAISVGQLPPVTRSIEQVTPGSPKRQQRRLSPVREPRNLRHGIAFRGRSASSSPSRTPASDSRSQSPQFRYELDSSRAESPFGGSMTRKRSPLSKGGSRSASHTPESSVPPRPPEGDASASATNIAAGRTDLGPKTSLPDSWLQGQGLSTPPPLPARMKISRSPTAPHSLALAPRFTSPHFLSLESSAGEDLAKSLPSTSAHTQLNSSPELDSDDTDVRGHLRFRLEYDYDSSCLSFHPIRMKNFRTGSRLLTSPPALFLKATVIRTNEILADGKLSLGKYKDAWKSKTYQGDVNPTFLAEDHHDFPCVLDRLQKMGLLMLVYDSGGVLTTGTLLGHIWVPLGGLDLTSSRSYWRPVTKGSRLFQNEGDIHHGNINFSVEYEPKADRLTVIVLKASGLTVDGLEYSSSIDPYVSVTLLRHGHEAKRKDTPVKKNTRQPVFNARIVFDKVTMPSSTAPAGSVEDCSLLVSVRAKTRGLRSDVVIGAILVGELSTDQVAKDHWGDVLKMPGKPVPCWHRLGNKPSKRHLAVTRGLTPLPSSSDDQQQAQ